MKKCGRFRQVADDSITRRIHFTCRMNKATDTQSEYAILIVFQEQQWLRERALMLRLYVYCMSCRGIIFI